LFTNQGGVSVYAIIQAGGRQIKVAPGATVQLDGTTGEAGAKVTFEQVLFLAQDGGELTAGAPFISGAKVLGVIDGEARGPKIRVFKKKRRKGMRRTKGHRAFYTRVRITDIQI
jgi:large subunit ribosomal protein L21